MEFHASMTLASQKWPEVIQPGARLLMSIYVKELEDDCSTDSNCPSCSTQISRRLQTRMSGESGKFHAVQIMQSILIIASGECQMSFGRYDQIPDRKQAPQSSKTDQTLTKSSLNKPQLASLPRAQSQGVDKAPEAPHWKQLKRIHAAKPKARQISQNPVVRALSSLSEQSSTQTNPMAGWW
jgi:hypothetical protein